MAEMYFSLDIEADGKIPGDSSMLSLGAAAFMPDGALVSLFEANLATLPEASPDPETMAWWAKQPEAWAHARQNPRDPARVMQEFHDWVISTARTPQGEFEPVPIAYPGAYDFMWIYWYLIRFLGKAPFSFSCLDIKTLALSVMGGGYMQVSKSRMPSGWTEGAPAHSHKASEDAWRQGVLFFSIWKELENLRKTGK